LFHAKTQRKRKGAKENFPLRLCVFFASLRETNSCLRSLWLAARISIITDRRFSNHYDGQDAFKKSSHISRGAIDILADLCIAVVIVSGIILHIVRFRLVITFFINNYCVISIIPPNNIRKWLVLINKELDGGNWVEKRSFPILIVWIFNYF
jgi:hypothetical protein